MRYRRLQTSQYTAWHRCNSVWHAAGRVRGILGPERAVRRGKPCIGGSFAWITRLCGCRRPWSDVSCGCRARPRSRPDYREGWLCHGSQSRRQKSIDGTVATLRVDNSTPPSTTPSRRTGNACDKILREYNEDRSASRLGLCDRERLEACRSHQGTRTGRLAPTLLWPTRRARSDRTSRRSSTLVGRSP